MADVIVKAYDNVDWSEEQFSLFLEMLDIGKGDSLIADVLQFLGARPIHVSARQLETSIEVNGSVYEPMISLQSDDYVIIIHEGSYYMLVDCTYEEPHVTILKPTLH